MLSYLITGATGPLGKALVSEFSKKSPKITCRLALTSRYPSTLNLSKPYIQHLFLDLDQDFYNSSFLSELKPSSPFDSIIHCASPYPTELLMQASIKSFEDFSKLIANEMCLLRELILHLKPEGSLIICGSISGMPSKEPGQVSNFEPSTLHATHKGLIRNFAYWLHRSNPSHSIIHLNLGPFITQVPREKANEILSSATVAKRIIKIIRSPKSNVFNIDILPKKTSKEFQLHSMAEQLKVSKEKSIPPKSLPRAVSIHRNIANKNNMTCTVIPTKKLNF